jgi:radical SAM family uncharacterized protein/radical SAM-linked protein
LNQKHKLWNKLELEVLPYVSKPARYTGNEINAVIKSDRKDLLRIALCFPEMYEIGMSYLGMQILYNLINKRTDCYAERAFAVWPDMENRLTEKDFPLFSLETSTPLNEFDVLGFHLTYEMTFTTALSMLDLAKIPLLSVNRRKADPLVIAGGPSVMNPEPMADFIDAFFIGEAEDSINLILNTLKQGKDENAGRESTLEKLGKIPGIYVPRFYEPVYDNSKNFVSLRKLNSVAPDRIKYVTAKELKSEYYQEKPLIPYIETAHDHLSVEIMRGCVRGCRFCQAGFQYRPRRQRKADDICTQVLVLLSETGYEDVTLLSLSSTDYDDLDRLLTKLSPRLIEKKVSLGLPSLRPETITLSLLRILGSVRKTGLTIAPEAGTERMRDVLGKNISDDEIFRAAGHASDEGYRSLKLYFMLGLPGETDEDIDGITSILRKISSLSRKGKGRTELNVTLSPFSPRSHTPWQWERQAETAELKEKLDRIAGGIRKPGIKIKYPDLRLSMLESILGRGDRRLGTVILNAYHNGSRLDGWSEWFDYDNWSRAFEKEGLNMSFYTRALNEDESLPWDHIDKGISKDFLRKDNELSRQAIPPKTKFHKGTGPERPVSGDFGRKSKRVAVHTTAAPGTYRLRVRFMRGRELRFLSHLDTIRTIYRAIRRSDIPVAFSEGYHPHIKISFGPPLPLGYTSEAEYFDLQLTRPFREEFVVSLNQELPDQLRITGHRQYFAKAQSLSKQLNLARYEIPLERDVILDDKTLQEILSSKSVPVIRIRDEIEKEIDAGRFIDDLRVEDSHLVADIVQTPDGLIKPEEILVFGFGNDSEKVKALVIHRKSQYHRLGQRLMDPLELV